MSDTPDEWSAAQNALYIRMHRFVVENPRMFQHPNADDVPMEYWACTAHNVAWHAAELLALDDDTALVIVDADSGEEMARESDGALQ